MEDIGTLKEMMLAANTYHGEIDEEEEY